MRILVIGGGITGRLVQHRIPRARIMDWAPPPTADKLTRMFGANYLWEPVGGLPCRAFPVVTHVDGTAATEDRVRAYKAKIGKAYDAPDLDIQFREHTTGYDFEQLPDARIEYNMRAVEINLERKHVIWSNGMLDKYDKVVSTIPLYSFIELTNMRTHLFAIVGGGRWAFKYDPIFVRVMQRPPDARFGDETLYVNYLSDPDVLAYRYCDRNGERHYESIKSLGVVASRKIVPGKIHPLDNRERLLDTLRELDVVTFGRFGSWQPDELVHLTWRQVDAWATKLGIR